MNRTKRLLKGFIRKNLNLHGEYTTEFWEYFIFRLRSAYGAHLWRKRRHFKNINTGSRNWFSFHLYLLEQHILKYKGPYWRFIPRNFSVRGRHFFRRKRTIRIGPRNVLHKKTFFRPINNKGNKGYSHARYPFCIRAKESKLFTPKLAERSRLIFSRPTKKIKHSKYKMNFNPYVSITTKPIQARMGKGKGKPAGFRAPIRKGEIIAQLNKKLRLKVVKKIHKRLSFKLPIFTKIIAKKRTKRIKSARKKFHESFSLNYISLYY